MVWYDMVWYSMVEVGEGAPVAVSGWVLTDRHDLVPCAATSLHRATTSCRSPDMSYHGCATVDATSGYSILYYTIQCHGISYHTIPHYVIPWLLLP